MKKLKPEAVKIYSVGGVQLFSKIALGRELGINRNTVKKNIDAWEVKPEALDSKGNALYSIRSYIKGMQSVAKDEDGLSKYGGYPDASEWKNAIAAKRDVLRYEKDIGLLVEAWDAEAEIAKVFSDCSRMGETLLTIVDNSIHPTGEEMELISRKFKSELSAYYDSIFEDE